MKKILLFLTFLSFVCMANAQIPQQGRVDTLRFSGTDTSYVLVVGKKVPNTTWYYEGIRENFNSDQFVVFTRFDSNKNQIGLQFKNGFIESAWINYSGKGGKNPKLASYRTLKEFLRQLQKGGTE